MLFRKSTYILLTVGFYLMINLIFNQLFYYDNFGKIFYRHNLFPEENEIFDVVVTGNSQPSAAIDFSLNNSINGLNIALGSQSLDFDYKMLNAFENNFDEETIILLTLTFFSFCDQYSGSTRRYDPFFETDYVLFDRIIERHLPLVGFERTSTTIKNTLSYISNFNQSEVDMRQTPYTEDLSTWEVDGLRRYSNHKSRSLCDDDVYDFHWEIVEQIISSNQVKGRQVFILTVPYHYSYFNNLKNDLIAYNLFYDRIEILINNFDVKHLDYSNDPRFYNDIKYFRDWDHMNSYGSEIFTKILINDLFGLNDD